MSRVNAIDKNGRVAWADKWTIDELREMEKFMGYRSFQKEMMNNPITEGAVFRHDWIRWKRALPLSRYDYLVAYCGPSFKGTSKNDYKAIKMWGKTGTELHQLGAFVRQCSVAEMVRWWYDLHEQVVAANAICYQRVKIVLAEAGGKGNPDNLVLLFLAIVSLFLHQ